MIVFLLSSKWFNKLDEISSLGFTHCCFHTHSRLILRQHFWDHMYLSVKMFQLEMRAGEDKQEGGAWCAYRGRGLVCL